MTPEKSMELARAYWLRVGPQPLWFVIDAQTGRVMYWSLPKRGAQKIARNLDRGGDRCLLARIAPGGY